MSQKSLDADSNRNQAKPHLEPLLEGKEVLSAKIDNVSATCSPIGYRPIPLDGGWGWMVVLGAFLIHVLADGFIYSFGVMSVQLIDTFNEGRGLTSWIVSVMIGLYLGIGPVAGAMTDRYGCRTTTLIGSLIATFGCAISYFATSILFLMGSVGIIMGIGFGLMYCPAIVIVTMYFERQRAFATGIAVCGAGVGTFLFAPLTQWLIEHYTWRGAFLIYAGIILNGAVCAMLFRPIQFAAIYAEDIIEPVPNMNSQSDVQVQLNGHATKKMSEGTVEHSQQSHDRTRSQLSIGRLQGSSVSILRPLNARSRSMHSLRRRAITMSTGYLHVKDAFYPGSVMQINEFKQEGDLYRSIPPTKTQMTAQAVEEQIGSRRSSHYKLAVDRSVLDIAIDNDTIDNTSNTRDSQGFFGMLKQLCYVRLLIKDPLFLLYAVSNFLTSAGLNPPLLLLPDMANQLGIHPTISSLCLSAFGISNTIGRVLFGYLCDRSLPCSWAKDAKRNRLWIYNILITFCGLSTVFCIFAQDWIALLLFASFFGFSLSAYICLTSVLLVDFIGMDQLTHGFGLLMLFQGVASFIGAPIAGLLVDVTGSYSLSFMFSGLAITMSAVMLYFVPFLQKHKSLNT